METDLLLALGGLVAGAFGALLGLGGGILIVPLLTIAFGVPLTTAIGTSLICVIATSTGAAGHNVRSGRADVRLGLTLALGTVVGAATGGIVAGFLPERALAGLFAALLAYTGYSMGGRLLRGRLGRRRRPAAAPAPADPRSIDAMAPDGPEAPAYRVRHQGIATAGSFVAGNVSGLLGVGGGVVVVPMVHLLMGAPLHVAVATSNFMIGITAAAGAYAYLFRGDVDPVIAGPVVIGVAVGADIGARLAPRIRADWLTALFLVVIAYVVVDMTLRALGVAT
jgi:uncharacterized membrane protein YfcA